MTLKFVLFDDGEIVAKKKGRKIKDLSDMWEELEIKYK